LYLIYLVCPRFSELILRAHKVRRKVRRGRAASRIPDTLQRSCSPKRKEEDNNIRCVADSDIRLEEKAFAVF
jgi:hypothetical protein